jgi:hypothetical protein
MLGLIDYPAFGAMRLQDFVPPNDPRRAEIDEFDDWEYRGSAWIGEGYGVFTVFLRPKNSPTALGAITLDLENLPDDIQASVLSSVGLPVRPGATRDHLQGTLGLPDREQRFMPDRITLDFRVGATDQYLVSLTVHQDRGLLFVEMIRADLLDDMENNGGEP